MKQEEILEYLVSKKIILKIGNEYYPVDKKLGIIGGKCKNLPDKFNNVTIKQMYKFFIDDCEIPYKHNGNFVYLLREETKEALNTLQRIINNPSIDYTLLVQKVKSYYKTITSPKPIKSFLSEGTWEAVYDSPVEKMITNNIMR